MYIKDLKPPPDTDYNPPMTQPTFPITSPAKAAPSPAKAAHSSPTFPTFPTPVVAAPPAPAPEVAPTSIDVPKYLCRNDCAEVIHQTLDKLDKFFEPYGGLSYECDTSKCGIATIQLKTQTINVMGFTIDAPAITAKMKTIMDDFKDKIFAEDRKNLLGPRSATEICYDATCVGKWVGLLKVDEEGGLVLDDENNYILK